MVVSIAKMSRYTIGTAFYYIHKFRAPSFKLGFRMVPMMWSDYAVRIESFLVVRARNMRKLGIESSERYLVPVLSWRMVVLYMSRIICLITSETTSGRTSDYRAQVDINSYQRHVQR